MQGRLLLLLLLRLWLRFVLFLLFMLLGQCGWGQGRWRGVGIVGPQLAREALAMMFGGRPTHRSILGCGHSDLSNDLHCLDLGPRNGNFPLDLLPHQVRHWSVDWLLDFLNNFLRHPNNSLDGYLLHLDAWNSSNYLSHFFNLDIAILVFNLRHFNDSLNLSNFNFRNLSSNDLNFDITW